MKLATFQAPSTPPRIGLVVAAGIVDLAKHMTRPPANMLGLIAAWQDYRSQLERLNLTAKPDVSLDAVTLLAPIARPGKILAIGLNYADHVVESGMVKPETQVWFAKMPTATNRPIGTLELPKVSEQLDYEAELAFVIGRQCRHVARDEAPAAIFGYCAANDVSVRDWQLRTTQFMLGKSFDTHAPFGPWIVTPDEIGDPHALTLRCLVNGEVRQQSNTKHLIFDCYAQVEHLSQVMTLEPGDVILTGTPAGVGIGFKPPKWLKAGDAVEVEIERIGSLRHTVVREPD